MKETPRIDIIPEKPGIFAGSDQTLDLLIRVTGPDVGIAARPPLNIAVVLDRSGSMGGEKIVRAREAASFCVEQMLPSDYLAVIKFDDSVDVVVPSTRVKEKNHILAAIGGIEVGGSTALHDAWVLGGLEISKHLREGAINRVLLITDGQANVGLTDHREIEFQADGCAERGVTTSTFGIGADFNEDLLVRMAEAGRGNAWHVQEAGEIAGMFEKELQGLFALHGSNVSLGIKPRDGVRVLDIFNDFEKTSTGRFKLPNLVAGRTIEVVIRLHISGEVASSGGDLLKLRLAWDLQGSLSGKASSRRQSIYSDFHLGSMTEEEWAAAPSDPQVLSARTLLTSARARREAIRRMDEGNYTGAKDILRSQVNAMLSLSVDIREDAHLAEDRAQLEHLQSELDDAGQIAMARKRAAYQAYHRKNSRR